MNTKVKFSKAAKVQAKSQQYDVYGSETSESENGFAKMLIATRQNSLGDMVTLMDGDEHKLESVTTKRGIEIINDSYAINANRLWYSLETMNKPTVWLTTFDEIEELNDSLIELINQKVKTIVTLSVFDLDILSIYKGLGKELIITDNMEEAVRKAFYAAEAGDAVLFSPGVRSEGQYASYRGRGTKFKEAVAQL